MQIPFRFFCACVVGLYFQIFSAVQISVCDLNGQFVIEEQKNK